MQASAPTEPETSWGWTASTVISTSEPTYIHTPLDWQLGVGGKPHPSPGTILDTWTEGEGPTWLAAPSEQVPFSTDRGGVRDAYIIFLLWLIWGVKRPPLESGIWEHEGGNGKKASIPRSERGLGSTVGMCWRVCSLWVKSREVGVGWGKVLKFWGVVWSICFFFIFSGLLCLLWLVAPRLFGEGDIQQQPQYTLAMIETLKDNEVTGLVAKATTLSVERGDLEADLRYRSQKGNKNWHPWKFQVHTMERHIFTQLFVPLVNKASCWRQRHLLKSCRLFQKNYLEEWDSLTN